VVVAPHIVTPPGTHTPSSSSVVAVPLPWRDGFSATPPVPRVEGLPLPEALSWLRRRGPDLSLSMLHKLFRHRHVSGEGAPATRTGQRQHMAGSLMCQAARACAR